MRINEILLEASDRDYDEAVDYLNKNSPDAIELIMAAKNGRIKKGSPKERTLRDLLKHNSHGRYAKIVYHSNDKKTSPDSVDDEDISPQELERRIKRINKDAKRLTQRAADDLVDEVKKVGIAGGDETMQIEKINEFLKSEVGEYLTKEETKDAVNELLPKIPEVGVKNGIKLAAQIMNICYVQYLKDTLLVGKKDGETDAKEPEETPKEPSPTPAPSKTPEEPKDEKPSEDEVHRVQPGTTLEHNGKTYKWLGGQWAVYTKNRKWNTNKGVKDSDVWRVYKKKKGVDKVIPQIGKEGEPSTWKDSTIKHVTKKDVKNLK